MSAYTPPERPTGRAPEPEPAAVPLPDLDDDDAELDDGAHGGANCDVAQVAQFLQLWTQVTDVPHVTLVAILPDAKVVHARTFACGDVEAACAWAADHQATGRNVYFQPNETRADCSKKPGKGDMVAARCRYADVDPDDRAHPWAEERDRLSRLAAALTTSEYPPTVIIDSGNGVQPIWAVTREALTPEVTARVEAETATLEHRLGAGGTHNVDRLLRLPGTANFPNRAKLAKGRGVTHARMIFAGSNLYRPDQVGNLVNGHLVEAGLVRPRPTSTSTVGHTVDLPEVTALIRRIDQAGGDKIQAETDLPEALWQRLVAAMTIDPETMTDHHYARRKRLADRWAGLVDDLTAAGRDDSHSGADMSLAAMLKAAGFSLLDTALVLLAFPHGKANNEEWPAEPLRLRHAARSVLRSHAPAEAAATAAINARALAALDVWVQRLFPAAVFQSGTGATLGAWRVPAESLLPAQQDDLVLHPDGIHHGNVAMTPVEVVMAFGGAEHAEHAIQLLADWLPDDARPRAPAQPAPVDEPDDVPDEWPEQMALAAYHGPLGAVVAELMPHTEADPHALHLQNLVMFGNKIGRGPYYRVGAAKHATNEYVLAVGDTSRARKGTSAEEIRAVYSTADASDPWVQTRLQYGLASGEGLIYAIRDETWGLDKKGERVRTDVGVTDKRLLVLETEFAFALAALQREGNTLSAVLRNAWDRPDLQTLTRNAPLRSTGALVSVIAHITTAELRARADQVSITNGLFNRFLFLAVRRARELPHGGAADTPALRRLAQVLDGAIQRARTVGQVEMDPDARALWADGYHDLTITAPGLVGSLTARAEAHVVRLSMVYALADQADQIKPVHLEAALAVWAYSAASVRMLFGHLLGDPVGDSAVVFLRAAGSTGMTRTELSNALGRNISSARIAIALQALQKNLMVRRTRSSPPGKSGPAPERWFYVRP